MSDPLLFSLVQDLEFQTGYRIKQVVATRGDIIEAIQSGYPDKALAIRASQAGSDLAVSSASRSRGASGESSGQETALVRRSSEDEVFEPAAGIKKRKAARRRRSSTSSISS